jgi:hypothetical protein
MHVLLSSYHLTPMDSLMQMSEIEREDILSQRLEEKQRLKDKRIISQMVKEQRSGESESVSKAAKRSFIFFVCQSYSFRLMTTSNRTAHDARRYEGEIAEARRTQS